MSYNLLLTIFSLKCLIYYKDIDIDIGKAVFYAYVQVCVRACVHLPHFCTNHYIAFIYGDIFTNFAENVYGYENMSVKIYTHLKKATWQR